MRVYLLSISFAGFLLSASFAQDTGVVKGQVLDAATRMPIPGVNVIVRGHKLGTITDSLGSFRLSLAASDSYVLVFSHIAYEKVTRSMSLETGKEVEYRILLPPTAIGMKEVVILGERPFVVTKYAEQTAIYKLDGNEFEKLGENRMEKAMRYLMPEVVKPVLDRMSAKNRGGRVVMGENDFTLYVDGVWMESLTLDDIDPFSVKRVMVWDANPFLSGGNTDLAPVAFPLRRGSRYVVLVQPK